MSGWRGSWALHAGRVAQVGHLHRERDQMQLLHFSVTVYEINHGQTRKTRKQVNPTAHPHIPAAGHLRASPWSSVSPSIPSYDVGDLFQIGTWSLSWPERHHHRPLTRQPLLPHLPLLSWNHPPPTGETAAPQTDASDVWGMAHDPGCSSWNADWSTRCPSSKERGEKCCGRPPRRQRIRSSELMMKRTDTAWCDLSWQADRSRCRVDGWFSHVWSSSHEPVRLHTTLITVILTSTISGTH